MSARMFAEPAAEMRRQAATYPTDRPMRQVKDDLLHLEEAMRDIASAFGIYAQRLSPTEQPLNPQIAEALGNIYEMLISATKLAGSVSLAVNTLHEGELRRIENPRPNEANWDLTRQ